MADKRIGFIGAGNMATAIARGLVSSGKVPASACLASDIDPSRREAFTAATGIDAVDDNPRVVGSCPVVVLAVKPQVAASVLAPLGEVVTGETLLVSIMAGVTAEAIERMLGIDARVVRTMPNMPLQLGAGITALSRGRLATDGDLERAAELFRPSGEVVTVEETLMDAVTATSGSGPAYFLDFAQAVIDGAMACQLDDATARKLVGWTLLGAARMVLETDDDLGEIVRRVTSPGGTTEAAFKVLQGGSVSESIRRAVVAARDRGIELGR